MNRFTKSDTTLVKGIGIILLMFHHIIGGDPGLPMDVLGTPFYVTIGTASKVCVSLFLILSGYGMVESSRIKAAYNYGFVFLRLKKLYVHFWECWIVLFIWASIRGYRPLTDFYFLGLSSNGPMYLIRDLLGFHSFGSQLTPTLSGVFWFMEAIVIGYLLFPIICGVFRKTNIIVHIAILLLTYSPWIYYQYKLDYAMHTDRTLFYIFSFCLGVFLSWYHIFDIIKEWSATRRAYSVLLSTGLLIAMLFIRQKYCLPADPFFAVAIIIFVICTFCQTRNTSIIKDTLLFFGKYESDLYLLHPALLNVFASIPFSHIFYKCVFTVLLCGAIIYSYSCGKTYIKGVLSQLYCKFFNRKRLRDEVQVN